MRRRHFLAATAADLAALREQLAALEGSGERHIRWAVSMFLWTSTQWQDDEPGRWTEMLDVIKDSGFDGFRLVGWPQSLEKYNMREAALERELSKRGLHLATLSFGGQADDPAEQPKILASAHEACRLLRRFGASELVVFSPRRVNKVLEREHIRVACEFYNRLGDLCAEYGIRAGLHNHSQGQLIESQDEVEWMLQLTDPQRFHWAPDTIHLYLGGCNIVELFEKYARRLIFMDYVDARYVYAHQNVHSANGKVDKAGTHNATFLLCNQDLGAGEIDFPALHRILKRTGYKGWINIDHHFTPVSPRYSFTRCRKYIRETLEPIYR